MGRILKIEGPDSLKYLKVLGSRVRLRIYDVLHQKNLSISEISQSLKISQSFVTKEVQQLEAVGLIQTVHRPGIRGSQKICSLTYDEIVYRPSPRKDLHVFLQKQIAIPIGAYNRFDITPPCGLIGEKGHITPRDDPRGFFNPKHTTAQMLWFAGGWVEYTVPRDHPKDALIEEMRVAMEVSSEGSRPVGQNECPSDISIWVNGTKVGPWHSWGFYTLKRGRRTPSWWPIRANQFGLLKEWKINREGSFVDDEKVSSAKINDLSLNRELFITLRVGMDGDDGSVGGVCLFGEDFGNHPQDILVTIKYLRKD